MLDRSVWVPYELITAAQKGCCYKIKDNQLLRQSGIDLTLTNLHAFNVYKKDGACFRVVYNYR